MIDNERLQQCNVILHTIGFAGRRFFYMRGRYSYFEAGKRGSLWFVDKWRGSRIYTNHDRRPLGWRFSEGGTLANLVKDMSRYIRGKASARQVACHFGPWHSWLCGGDPWAYGDDMPHVRNECRRILGIENSNSTDDAVVGDGDGAEG